MPNIEEDAFQVARYLLENPNKDEQIQIRNDLSLSDENFRLALKFLIDKECLKSAGQFGKGIISRKNLAKLQDFVSQIDEKRIPLSRRGEHLLKMLFADQIDFPFSLGDHITEKLCWAVDQYAQVAQELSDKGFVQGEYASGNPFFKISLLPDGREVVRNNFRLPNSLVNSVQLAGNNNVVNINSTLTSVTQLVQTNFNIDSSSKQKIADLLDQLSDVLKDLPGENVDDGETVAELAKKLIENATKEKPNKKLIEISAEGLKKAAKDLEIIIPSVLLISEKLISFILSLHR
jgi:hypothetical protein